MTDKNKLTLYHGSPKIIQQPVFGEGSLFNDYGRGFYCTELPELAKEWACFSPSDGYANKYTLNTEGLSVLSLTRGDFHILNWLFILLENRRFRIGGNIALQAKDYISTNFAIDYKGYDIITGYRADDSYFSFAAAFLNNTISLQQLENAMVLGKLGEQIVLKSPEAFSRISFEEAIPAPGAIYYPLRLARDTAAREDFQKERGRDMLLSDKYILDIIREGWKNDDERLQRVILA